MTALVRFDVPGQPVGKERPRVTQQGKASRLYTPAKTASYERAIGYRAKQAMRGRRPIGEPVFVTLDIRVQIPASWSKVKKEQARAGTTWPSTKPDIDNVEKALFDGMNGVVWKDDVQVVRVLKQKRYSDQPGVEVYVWLAHEQEEQES